MKDWIKYLSVGERKLSSPIRTSLNSEIKIHKNNATLAYFNVTHCLYLHIYLRSWISQNKYVFNHDALLFRCTVPHKEIREIIVITNHFLLFLLMVTRYRVLSNENFHFTRLCQIPLREFLPILRFLELSHGLHGHVCFT